MSESTCSHARLACGMSYFWTAIRCSVLVRSTFSMRRSDCEHRSHWDRSDYQGKTSNNFRPTMSSLRVIIAERYASVTATMVRWGVSTRNGVGALSNSCRKSAALGSNLAGFCQPPLQERIITSLFRPPWRGRRIVARGRRRLRHVPCRLKAPQAAVTACGEQRKRRSTTTLLEQCQ